MNDVSTTHALALVDVPKTAIPAPTNLSKMSSGHTLSGNRLYLRPSKTDSPMSTKPDRPSHAQRLRAALEAAQEQRPARNTVVDGVVGFVAYERAIMFELVNKIRAEGGRGPMPMSEIRKAEDAAVGHIDFSVKWVRYLVPLCKGPVPDMTLATAGVDRTALQHVVDSAAHDLLNARQSLTAVTKFLAPRLATALEDAPDDAARLALLVEFTTIAVKSVAAAERGIECVVHHLLRTSPDYRD